MARAKMKERRRDERMALVERRKGKVWLYGELIVFIVAVGCLVTLAW